MLVSSSPSDWQSPGRPLKTEPAAAAMSPQLAHSASHVTRKAMAEHRGAGEVGIVYDQLCNGEGITVSSSGSLDFTSK